MKPWTIHQGDCLDVLRTLPAESVQTCVTSPPYWGQRDYNTATWDGGDPGCDHKPDVRPRAERPSSGLQSIGYVDDAQQPAYRDVCGKCGATRQDQQIGLEETPEAYVQRMVEVFREVRRVLRKDGTLWLNLGDSFAGGKMGRADKQDGGGLYDGLQAGWDTQTVKQRPVPSGLKPKDLIGIPWRVALALQADGWYLRSDIIWSKPNPMPESVTDRPTKSHEYVFLLAKSERYYYDQDAIREITGREADPEFYEQEKARLNGWTGEDATGAMARQPAGAHGNFCHPSGRNKRTVWTIPSEPYPGAHFATYPTRLVEPCVQAGTSQRGCCPVCAAPWERVTEKTSVTPVDYEGKWAAEDPQSSGRRLLANVRARRQSGQDHDHPFPSSLTLGWRPTCPAACPGHREEPVPAVVLDPFCGSGTTGEVALAFGRHFVGIELNPAYIALAEQRLTLLPSYTGRRKAAPKTDAGQLSILEEVA